MLEKGDGEREGREEGFQHEPPFIDTIENINMSSTRTVERWLIDSECRKQESKKERKKEKESVKEESKIRGCITSSMQIGVTPLMS